jgi:hypothetical protein
MRAGHYMDKAWFGLLSAIIGATIGIAATYIKIRHDEKLERRRLYLQKLEEVHKIITKIMYINLTNAEIAKSMSPISWASVAKPLTKYDNEPFVVLGMLIDFYFSDLRFFYDGLDKLRINFIALLKRFNECKVDKQNIPKELLNQLNDQYILFNDDCLKLQRKIIEISKKYL